MANLRQGVEIPRGCAAETTFRLGRWWRCFGGGAFAGMFRESPQHKGRVRVVMSGIDGFLWSFLDETLPHLAQRRAMINTSNWLIYVMDCVVLWWDKDHMGWFMIIASNRKFLVTNQYRMSAVSTIGGLIVSARTSVAWVTPWKIGTSMAVTRTRRYVQSWEQGTFVAVTSLNMFELDWAWAFHFKSWNSSFQTWNWKEEEEEEEEEESSNIIQISIFSCTH